jgi:hypothetical protein
MTAPFAPEHRIVARVFAASTSPKAVRACAEPTARDSQRGRPHRVQGRACGEGDPPQLFRHRVSKVTTGRRQRRTPLVAALAEHGAADPEGVAELVQAVVYAASRMIESGTSERKARSLARVILEPYLSNPAGRSR